MFRVNHISAIAALLVLSGCVSNPDLGESSLGLFEPGEAMPVAEHLWQSAAEGCEDALGPDIDYREAENAPDLVVCVTPSGDIVCVDTAAAIQREVEQMGEDLLLELGSRPRGAMSDGWSHKPRGSGSGIYQTSALSQGDPTPQPSLEGEEDSAGSADPTPQPSASGGDPTPQPSVNGGDPTPQPSHQGDGDATAGDPTPQPSNEASDDLEEGNAAGSDTEHV